MTPSNANTPGLAEIISDDEILRVHGHADFGPLITPREVVNEGVLKYAFGYCSGHTQLCILMEHGLITKPRPGRYDASLTKKGKRYARALGGYQNAVTAASAQARIAELEQHAQDALTEKAAVVAEYIKSVERLTDRATAAEARADRLVEISSKLDAAISWLDYPFIDNRTPEAELRQRVGFMMKDAEPHRAALQQETQQ